MAAELKALAKAVMAAEEAWRASRTSEAYAAFVGAKFDLRNAAAPEAVLAIYQERDEAAAENARLRAALAVSKDPCVYCQLPAEEMAKCRAGFPGCDRADDMMGCAEFGAALEAAEQRESAEAYRLEAERLRLISDGLAADLSSAIRIAFKYGGRQWVQVNYPAMYRTLVKRAGADAPLVWEFFCDESYFDLWCVRPKGETRFGYAFHVMTEKEASELAALLGTTTLPGEPDA